MVAASHDVQDGIDRRTTLEPVDPRERLGVRRDTHQIVGGELAVVHPLGA